MHKTTKKGVETVGLEPTFFLMADGHASSEPRELKDSIQKKVESGKTMNYR